MVVLHNTTDGGLVASTMQGVEAGFAAAAACTLRASIRRVRMSSAALLASRPSRACAFSTPRTCM
jgi:hypothetical protein